MADTRTDGGRASGDDDGEWRFGVDEVGEDGVVRETPDQPVERGSPSAENVVFFLLGAAIAVGVFALLLVG
ncbi:hypothetical protein MBEHAL_0676 [Halarchaeum acidiphilum MH1-52-1]|uniref:DUF7312 domain-containing protein n=1 Tax=Halarchaeum acidiphilum MH1-52-1 TaxID=1261545 RepID=U2YDY3_9EURY|nr:hypothetical protein [Halarchaeum acidiphilum]GAD51916.1 hypothetical protein MBEHAL_0676 [Halarchaeum acidiphilum MH1-52-1]